MSALSSSAGGIPQACYLEDQLSGGYPLCTQGVRAQALGHAEPYMVFRAQGITLATGVQFISKVNKTFHTSKLINLSAFHSDSDPMLRSLCLRYALKYYLDQTKSLPGHKLSPQLSFL